MGFYLGSDKCGGSRAFDVLIGDREWKRFDANGYRSLKRKAKRMHIWDSNFAFLMGWIIESKRKGYLLFSSFPLNTKDGLLLDVDDVECFHRILVGPNLDE